MPMRLDVATYNDFKTVIDTLRFTGVVFHHTDGGAWFATFVDNDRQHSVGISGLAGGEPGAFATNFPDNIPTDGTVAIQFQ